MRHSRGFDDGVWGMDEYVNGRFGGKRREKEELGCRSMRLGSGQRDSLFVRWRREKEREN